MSQKYMKKKLLQSLGLVLISSSAIFGFATQASAREIKAGPIWSNADAQTKCPAAAAAVNREWSGEWRTTIQGRESVCSVYDQEFTQSVNAGAIWSNADAQTKCPAAAAAVNREWNGEWRTTVQGRESVCFLY
jgi:ribosome modulation factor